MNKIEFWLMNNPVRSFIQIFEARQFRKMSKLGENKTVLEIGCGQGIGTKLIKKYFKPEKIYAIDLDPEMIKRAENNVHDKDIRFNIGDAAKLNFPDNHFDAIFDFGIIHHIPNWKDCLKELNRVLKPGGEIIIEDLSKETFSTAIGRFFKLILKHPYEEMFTRVEFFRKIKKLNLEIINKYSNHYWFSVILKKKR